MKMLLLVWVASLLFTYELYAQTYSPALQDTTQLKTDRNVTYTSEGNKKGIKIGEGAGSSVILFNNITFGSGVIEFDVKGRNMMGQSFVGVAFHIKNDSTYDAVYFRPFNFVNPDTVRRWRAVQYISLPKYDWDVLREKFPGKYENKVNPVPNPDEWFHAKVVIKGKLVTVFVNNNASPCLSVQTLGTTSMGNIGLWVDNGSDGSFANVKIKRE